MPRVKRGTVRRAKRKKLSKLTKGYFQNKSKLYKFMREAAEKAGVYAYTGRKRKKRDFRSLWVVRINAAAREHGLSYSVFMHGLKAAGIELDRKSLSELAIHEPAAFAALAAKAKDATAAA
ncbi:MAG: 50S ribosomal protein L20 [Vicinamibacterales bacterium]|nr:50S ribosomal protein L20 [Vicinamibacterales bacterium]